jgi:hypothetical protein
VSWVFNLFVFRELENNFFGRKIIRLRCFNRGSNTQLRFIDGVWHEVDADVAVDTQLCGQLDRLDTTGLVEPVNILGVDLFKHIPRRLAIQSAR